REVARKILGPAEVHAWNPEEGPPPVEAFEGVEAIFHLAGDSVASGRWTAAKKARIRASRVQGTANLVQGIRNLKSRPRVLVSASAVGYYGQRGSGVGVHDVLGLMLDAATGEINASASLSIWDGPMNAVAPEPVTNQEFTRTLARVLHRPAVFPVPRFALALLFGELSTLLLASQRVVPRVAERTGYKFRFTSLEEALRQSVGG